MMQDNWNFGLKMLLAMVLVIIVVSADEVVNAGDSKQAAQLSEIAAAQGAQQQPKEQGLRLVKRAWKQLQSGWGKRNFNEEDNEDSIEELQRKIWKMYADQLKANNQIEENAGDYEADYDGQPMDKRAWKQMNGAWGKRDWNQLRGTGWGKREMRGLSGKRAQAWNKLSSAWGK